MKIWKILIASLLLSPLISSAEEFRRVPEKLFGITLGGVYDIGDTEKNEIGNLPVKKFAGVNRFLGEGIHYYFQPKDEYKIFKYFEIKKNPEDLYFETSFRLYLFPVISSSISTLEQLKKTVVNWEVATIAWSNDARTEIGLPNDAKTKEDAYFWALDLCKTIELDFLIKPEIINYREENWYQCNFSSENRVFMVSSYSSKRIELSYKSELLDEKDEAVEKKRRRIQLDEIRPY